MMQLKIETLEELQSEDEDINARSLDKILSRYSSLDSLDQVSILCCFLGAIATKDMRRVGQVFGTCFFD
jgi:hypothetical protein